MRRRVTRKQNTDSPFVSSIMYSVILFMMGLMIAGEIHPIQDDGTTTSLFVVFLIAINIGLFRTMQLHKPLQCTHRIRYWSFKDKSIFCLYLFLIVLMLAELIPYGQILIIVFFIGLIHIGFRPVKNQIRNLDLSFLTNRTSNQLQTTIEDIDQMDGLEFEKFLADLYTALGYNTELTSHTDYGIDVIISKDNIKAGIQAKCYGEGRTVGVEAVNQVCGGSGVHEIQKKIIITNRYYTRQALFSAQFHHIEMINRDGLIRLLMKYEQARVQKRSFGLLSFFNRAE